MTCDQRAIYIQILEEGELQNETSSFQSQRLLLGLTTNSTENWFNCFISSLNRAVNNGERCDITLPWWQPAQQAFPIELLGESQSGSKKKVEGGGGEEKRKPSFPSPSPVILFFFCSCPSFLDEPREETLATQATMVVKYLDHNNGELNENGKKAVGLYQQKTTSYSNSSNNSNLLPLLKE